MTPTRPPIASPLKLFMRPIWLLICLNTALVMISNAAASASLAGPQVKIICGPTQAAALTLHPTLNLAARAAIC